MCSTVRAIYRILCYIYIYVYNIINPLITTQYVNNVVMVLWTPLTCRSISDSQSRSTVRIAGAASRYRLQKGSRLNQIFILPLTEWCVSVSVVSVSVRAECRLKDLTRGPTKSHSNNNIEKPETHLSQERDVKITVASDLNTVWLQASDLRAALHSTVQTLQRVTGPSQHSTDPAESDRPFTAQYRPCRQ